MGLFRSRWVGLKKKTETEKRGTIPSHINRYTDKNNSNNFNKSKYRGRSAAKNLAFYLPDCLSSSVLINKVF